MSNEFIMYKFALLKWFSYFCLLCAFVLCFVSSDECISEPLLNEQNCTDILCGKWCCVLWTLRQRLCLLRMSFSA